MDYYLEDRARLEGQPKRAIADYVEQNGSLVPHRFGSLQEAKKSGIDIKDIFLRSEHPQEYDGVSGLLESFGLNYVFRFQPSLVLFKDFKDLNDLTQAYIEFIDLPPENVGYKRYCDLLGLDRDEFKGQVSFSIWEWIHGFNRVVVGDSSIPGRHHVMTKGDDQCNYAIVDGGKLTQEYIDPLNDELKRGLEGLVGTYESVRNLGRFDPNNCPIMKFVTLNGKNYFLQYHRTRDFTPAGFTLDRAVQDGEVEVPFVRGATPEQGAQFKVTVYYANQDSGRFDPGDEDGSWDLHFDPVFSELRVRQRRIQMMCTEALGENPVEELKRLVVGHRRRSMFYKPGLSIINHVDHFLIEGETTDGLLEKAINGQASYMTLNVVSDGKRGLVRRIA